MKKIQTLASPDAGTSAFLSLLKMEFGETDSQIIETGDQEHVINVLAGTCAINIFLPDETSMSFDPVGSRENIFGGKPEMVYVPFGSRYEVICRKEPFEAVIYTAPTDQYAPPEHVKPEQVQTIASGKSDWQRQVHVAMGENGPATRMIVGESESPPGNWSSFPPHRHTQDNHPDEANLEELYYFNFQPDSGFILGGIYDDPAAKEDARVRVFRHGQIFDVPKGYHFLAPCPGHETHYTWALGGQTKAFGAWIDDHELSWLNEG